MDGPYTRALAEYISGSAFKDLPAPLVEHAKLHVLDGEILCGHLVEAPQCLRRHRRQPEPEDRSKSQRQLIRFSFFSPGMDQ